MLLLFYTLIFYFISFISKALQQDQMEKEFSIELKEQQAEFLNTLMPNGHSVQIFEKYERRKKAQKKLDDMYVAEFSLRPVKKVKKENQYQNEKNQGNFAKKGHVQTKQREGPKSYNNNLDKVQKLHNLQQKSVISVQKQKLQMHKQRKQQQTQFRSSRSQRVSRPTEAYMQFQSQAFKRKFIEKQQPKIEKQQASSLVKTTQKTKNNGQQKDKISHVMKTDGLIELKSIIAEKIQRKVQNKCQLQSTKRQKVKQQLIYQEQLPQQGQNNKNNSENNKKQKLCQGEQSRQLPYQKQYKQSLDKNDQTIFAKRYLTQERLQEKINQPTRNNLLFTVLSEKFEQLQQMPQTRRNTLKLQQQIKQNKLLTAENKKESIQNEKLCPNNNRSLITMNKIPKITYNLSIKQPTLTRAWRILQRLKLHKSSWPFRYPVDPISQGVPDYFEKIKQPMDLKTIQKKLKSQKYKSQQQFFKDVELMLQNSYTYNPQSSNYYKLTYQLQNFFNELRAKSYIPKSSSGRSYSSNRKSSQLNQQQQEQQDQYYKGQEMQQQQQQLEKQLMLSGSKRNVQQQGKCEQLSAKKRKNYMKLDPSSSTSKRQRQIYQMEQHRMLQKRSKVIVTNDNQAKKINKQTVSQKIENEDKIEKQRAYQQEKKNQSIKNLQKKPLILIGSNTLDNKQQQQQNKQKKNQHLQQSNKQSRQQNKKLQQQINRMGYNNDQDEEKVPLIYRQLLLYDILHLQQEKSLNELYQFIIGNQLLYQQLLIVDKNDSSCQGQQKLLVQQSKRQQNKNKQVDNKQVNYKQPDNKQVDQEKQQQQQIENKNQQQLQFELGNLNIEGYKILRAKVNKLIIQQQPHTQQLNQRIMNNQQLQQIKQLQQLK